MLNETVKAFVEGRGSLASLERAIEQAHNPLMARAEMEKELAAEWALKNLFATIPPPTVGLSRVLAALRSAPSPAMSPERAESMKQIDAPLRATLKGIPEPAGGFSAAIARLKTKLAAAPTPTITRTTEMDIEPSFSESDAPVKKTKRATQKVVRLPQHMRFRDVLAAGKDLPENPNDIPDSPETGKK